MTREPPERAARRALVLIDLQRDANPAMTIARSLTITFSGIRPIDVPLFILAQCIGAVAALGVARMPFPARAAKPEVLLA